MASSAKKIQHLIIARLAHELSNPLGTLYNALEVLEDETDKKIQNQSLNLAKRSAQKIITRLKFYSLAYGDLPYWDPDLITDFLKDKSLDLKMIELPVDLEIALNIMAFFAEIAEPGAQIQCSAHKLSLSDFTLSDDPILDVLQGTQKDPLTPRGYQAFVTAAMVKDQHKNLRIETSQKNLTVTIL